jgi:hypothetical protein
MSNNPYGMTSREAAALYLSDGYTDDAELASMLDAAKKQPELLMPRGVLPQKDYQPPALTIEDADNEERIRLRNAIGFDVEVKIDPIKNRATLKDTELKLYTRCTLSDDADEAAAAMSKAMIRLKTKHDAKVATL